MRMGCVTLKRESASIKNSAKALQTANFDKAEGP
jgi:hypothetical protein